MILASAACTTQLFLPSYAMEQNALKRVNSCQNEKNLLLPSDIWWLKF
jgi:hypothetical protein